MVDKEYEKVGNIEGFFAGLFFAAIAMVLTMFILEVVFDVDGDAPVAIGLGIAMLSFFAGFGMLTKEGRAEKDRDDEAAQKRKEGEQRRQERERIREQEKQEAIDTSEILASTEEEAVTDFMALKGITAATKILRIKVLKLEDGNRPGKNVDTKMLAKWEKSKVWEDPLYFEEWCKREHTRHSLDAVKQYTDYVSGYEEVVKYSVLSRFVSDEYRRVTHEMQIAK